MSSNEDIWSEWLKKGRFGSDPKFQEQALQQYRKLASNIINKAQIFESATILDIGAGDGLVGLAALEKLGHSGRLILNDISEAALSIPKEIVNRNKSSHSRIEFLVSSVEDLSGLKSDSIDRVVARAVFLYVNNKQKAFDEVFRVLKNEGIAVILEPINQRMIEFRNNLFRGYRLDIEPLLSIQDLLKKVIDETSKHVNTFQSTLIGYNEHDLVHMSLKSGFNLIQMEYCLNRSSEATYSSWEFFFDTAPNPKAQTLHQIMEKVLTKDEFNAVVEVLKKVYLKPPMRTSCEALYFLKK
jgi:arsenite methyltransferase